MEVVIIQVVIYLEFKWKNLFKKEVASQDTTSKELNQYYDRTKIDETNASYRMIIGQRSNGKTFSVLKTILENYLNKGQRAAYIRRYQEEIQPKNIQLLFDQPALRDLIIELSGGNYNGTFYRANCFYLVYYDEDGKIKSKDTVPFCITRAVNTWQTTKGQDAGALHLICFDEFMTRDGYLKDEFISFCNLLSSLVRDRDDVVIYMLANTVNKYCPYFNEMGLGDVSKIPQGELRVYNFGQSELRVALEYCDPVKATQKVANKLFAFDNPQLEMVKNGKWEIKNYARAPYPIHDDMVLKDFYVLFNEQMIRGRIVKNKTDLFLFFNRQTKDVKIDNLTPFYSNDFSSSMCHVRYLQDCPTAVHKLICDLVKKNSMCFSDNEVGELIRNWLIDQGITTLL